MPTFHTQQQSLGQLVSTSMKEKPLVENVLLAHTETKNLAHPFIFSVKFFQFYDGSELKKGLSCQNYYLFNLLVKKGYGGKIMCKLYFFMGNIFFIFSCEERHFTALWIAVSYFALEAIVEWCSAKVGVLRKAVLKCSSPEPLVNIFESSISNRRLHSAETSII